MASGSQPEAPGPGWWWAPVRVFFLTRLVLLPLGAYVSQAFPWERSMLASHPTCWIRWDSFFYLSIADSGYQFEPGMRCNAAFFPGYPALVCGLDRLLGDLPLAALLVSHLAFLGALVLFYRFHWESGGGRTAAEQSLWYLCLFPSSFIFCAAYSESLFLLTAVGALYAAQRQRWDWAVAAAIWVSATRPTGLVVALAVVLEWRGRNWRQAPLLLLAPLGLVAVMGLQLVSFGHATGFMETQEAWGRGGGLLQALGESWRVLRQSPASPGLYSLPNLLNLLTWLGGMVLSWRVFRRFGWILALYCVLQLVIPASTGSLMSMTRFVLTAFPLFWVLGNYERTLMAVFGGLQVLLLTMWTNGFFVL